MPMDSIDSLKEEFGKRFPLRTDQLTFQDRSWNIYSAASLDRLLDELILKPDGAPEIADEQLPYWAELWPSSIGLMQWISETDNLSGSGLELGCGIGLAGMAAAAKGIKVCISDYMADAGRLAQLNWQVNLGKDPEFLLIDWRNPPRDRVYDFILMADVAYECRNFAPLIDAFKMLLQPDGQILIAEPGRPIAREFFQQLEMAGFRDRQENLEIKYRDQMRRIDIHAVTRKAGTTT